MSDPASAVDPSEPTPAPVGLSPTGKTKKPFYKRKLLWLLGGVVLIMAIYALNNPRPYSSAPAAGWSAPAVAPKEGAAAVELEDGPFGDGAVILSLVGGEQMVKL